MTDQEDALLVEKANGVLRLTINRPERRNALTNALIRRLGEELLQANDDRALKAIVLGAVGDKAFCAGADLKDSDTPFQFDHSVYHTPFANLLRIGYGCDVPIIGKLNGACLAGGMGLFGICDIVVAAEGARIGLPEAKVGIYPMQVLAVLRDLIPRRILAEMCITGAPLTAAQALAVGIVNRVVPLNQLDAAIEELLVAIKAVSAVAVRRGKYASRSMDTMSFDQMIAFAETQVAPLALTEDAREGRESFAARRAPIWPNR